MLFQRLLALEIGNSSIKLAQVVNMGKKLNIQKCGMIPTPQGTIDNGRIVDAEKLAESVNEQLKVLEIKAKDVVLTVSGTSVITREVVLPKAGEKELRSMIEMNSSEYFPVSLDGYIMDFKVLEELKEGGAFQYRILLVAVPAAIIEGYISLAELCGLNIHSVDYSGNSISKLMAAEPAGQGAGKKDNEGETVTLVDIGGRTITVTILKGRVLQFSRVLLYGGEQISGSIAESLNISVGEAEKVKVEKGELFDSEFYTENGEAVLVSNAIRSVMLNFADDISRFFEYYRSRQKENQISMILLTGGGSQIKGLEQYIEKALNIKTRQLAGYKSVSLSGSCKACGNWQKYFGVCLGAVL